MQATVAGTIRFQARDCPPKVLERLHRDLSFPNPEYVSRRRMGRYLGATPETIDCLLEDAGGAVELPRGAAALLRRRLSEVGDRVEFVDHRVSFGPLGLSTDVDLRPYQAQAVHDMRRSVQGYVVMPCGAGKTVAGAAAIGAIDQPSLVIVHTHDLLEQWREKGKDILGVEAGVIAEGGCKLEPVTVATVQSLVRMNAGELEAIGARFGCVVVDEAHHTPASTFQVVLAALPARYRFGLTATPEREDGLTPLLNLTLGDRLFTIGYAELVEAGYLQAPEVRYVYSSFDFPYEGPEDHARCMSALIADTARNELIADLAAREANDGHTVLVLSGRVQHCRRLARRIGERGVVSKVLVGDVSKADRQSILAELRNGGLRVAVASTLADEGLDVPQLDRIILAFPGRTRGRTTQRLGRLMRPHPGKGRPVLFDVVDSAVPPLLRQYRERRRLYTRLLAGGGGQA